MYCYIYIALARMTYTRHNSDSSRCRSGRNPFWREELPLCNDSRVEWLCDSCRSGWLLWPPTWGTPRLWCYNHPSWPTSSCIWKDKGQSVRIGTNAGTNAWKWHDYLLEVLFKCEWPWFSDRSIRLHPSINWSDTPGKVCVVLLVLVKILI